MTEPQQARAVRTRAQIVDGAARVFADKGYDASINDITEASGIKKGAVYHHFPTKEAIAEAVMADGFVMDESAVASAPLAQTVVDTSIRLAVLTSLVPSVRAASRLSTEPGTPFYQRLWHRYGPVVRTILDRARHEGELLPWVDPAAVTTTWVAGYTGYDVMRRPDPEHLPQDIAGLNRAMAVMCFRPETLRELDLTVRRGELLAARHPKLRAARSLTPDQTPRPPGQPD
ncbi:TetR family transcriptional regulator [Streptomyces sp. G45]|uniref:TetR family transcriptional regulator n=1 Tax=Streptomyces sp. G45 TaxID=3406627 RepID=UPI003C1E4307